MNTKWKTIPESDLAQMERVARIGLESSWSEAREAARQSAPDDLLTVLAAYREASENYALLIERLEQAYTKSREELESENERLRRIYALAWSGYGVGEDWECDCRVCDEIRCSTQPCSEPIPATPFARIAESESIVRELAKTPLRIDDVSFGHMAVVSVELVERAREVTHEG